MADIGHNGSLYWVLELAALGRETMRTLMGVVGLVLGLGSLVLLYVFANVIMNAVTQSMQRTGSAAALGAPELLPPLGLLVLAAVGFVMAFKNLRSSGR